jgi:protein phosphatase PTC7
MAMISSRMEHAELALKMEGTPTRIRGSASARYKKRVQACTDRPVNRLVEAKMMTMESLRQFRQTLSEIDERVPDALRVGLGFGNRVSPAPAPGEDDDVADFAASLLQPLVATKDDGDPAAEPDVTAPAPATLRLDWASCYVPRHDHDAHFGNAEAGVLGVADGVGSYMEDGVDAGAFARGLMRNAAAEVAAAEPGGPPVCPRALLERAYEKTAAARAPGASTAVILSLAGNALRWVHIGDSSFAVVRDGRVVFFSQPQQDLSPKSKKKLCQSRHDKKRHDCQNARWRLLFSFDDPPFQLSAKGHGNGVAKAKSYADASQKAVAVRAGDVVVAGTDGLFNNMLGEQLGGAVRMGTRLGLSPKNMADIVAGVAYERSREPLARKLCRGKPDDITVVVAFVVESDS